MDRETSAAFEDAQEKEVKMPPPMLRRADTFEELKNVVSSFSTALLSFLQAVIGLLPRLGTRAVHFLCYGLVACGVLYLFIVRGGAVAFVNAVRGAGATLEGSGGGGSSVKEF